MSTKAGFTELSSGHTDLVAEALPILQTLQAAITAVIAGVPQQIRRATDLAKALDLDYSLSWNLYRVATATDALQAGPHIPSSATMRRFLQSAGDKGVAAATITHAEATYAEFEAIVKNYAPDRAAFSSMIRDVHGSATAKEDLKFKRAAYRANRHIYGVHADLSLQILILHPSMTDGAIDVIGMNGYVNIQQARSDTTLLSESGVRFVPGAQSEMLDERAWDGPAGVSLLQDFCSQPLPEFRTFIEDNKMVIMEAHSRAIGAKGVSTYFFGSVSRSMMNSRTDPQPVRSLSWQINVPSEIGVRDVWLHKDVWPNTRPSVEVHCHRGGFEVARPLRKASLLPLKEEIIEIEQGMSGSYLPEYPRYPQMVRYAMDRLEWKSDEFRLFRSRMEYPVQGGVSRLVFPTGEISA